MPYYQHLLRHPKRNADLLLQYLQMGNADRQIIIFFQINERLMFNSKRSFPPPDISWREQVTLDEMTMMMIKLCTRPTHVVGFLLHKLTESTVYR